MPKQLSKLKKTKAQKKEAAKSPPPKPFIPLPRTFEKLQNEIPYGRIGVLLPLGYDGVSTQRIVKKKSLIFKTILGNLNSLMTMIEKMIGPKVRGGNLNAYQSPSSQNRILWVNMGDLLTDVFPRLSEIAQKQVLHKVWRLFHRAFWMTRSFGYRLILHYDLPVDNKAIKFMMELHWVMRQLEADYASFTIPFSSLTDPDYRLSYDTKVIKVVVDLPMEDKARSDYLTWCLRNKLDFIMELSKGDIRWIKEEKTRIRQATRPLIVLQVPPIKMESKHIDAAMLKIAPLCKYTDVLLKH
jgi:hypothetical protein